MYIEAFELDINNISNYKRDDIKTIFKKIALECHPDKLCHLKDTVEKNSKIERFKVAGIAYKLALEDFEKYGKLSNNRGSDFDYDLDDLAKEFNVYKDVDIKYWGNLFYDKISIQKTFFDVAGMFIKKGVKSNNYYNPSTKVIQHSIVLPVSYHDLNNSKKKRLSILLKGVNEPFNISILCKKEYPFLIRQYIDDDGIEHEITIKMIIENNVKNNLQKYSHKLNNENIDLFTTVKVNLQEYILGTKKYIQYVDNDNISIDIPPFNKENIIVLNKGLFGGNLIVKILFNNISNKKWNNVDNEIKKDFIKILDDMYLS